MIPEASQRGTRVCVKIGYRTKARPLLTPLRQVLVRPSGQSRRGRAFFLTLGQARNELHWNLHRNGRKRRRASANSVFIVTVRLGFGLVGNTLNNVMRNAKLTNCAVTYTLATRRAGEALARLM